MRTELIKRVKQMLKKDLVITILVSLMVGCGVGLFISPSRSSGTCILTESAVGTNDSKMAIDLSGAVAKPGVYELEAGSRVGDLVNLGGGAKGQAAANWISRNLNLAEKLSDSSKVYIPFEWETYEPEKYGISKIESSSVPSVRTVSSSTTPASKTSRDEENNETGVQNTTGKVNVNTATSSELDALPGIGPAYAEKIISGRPYEDAADFESKSGLWKSTIEGVKDLITF